jgi:regulatory protein
MMGTITTIEIQKRNKERANIYLDGDYAFSLSLIEAAQLRKGQTLTDVEVNRLRETDAITRAVDQAARFLAYRPRSTEEVRRNLTAKKFIPAVIDPALDRLRSLGYLDDEAFARFWLDNRQTFKPRSPRALRYELRQKGVADSIIDAVLADMDVQETAYQAAQERIRRLKGLDRKAFRQKLGGFLQRRGFSYGVSHAVIQQLESELVEEDPEYFVDPAT